MGRALSCGSRTASPASATIRKAVHLAQREGVAKLSISAQPWRLSSSGLAPHFNLDVVVQFVSRVPVAVEANITAIRALGIDQLTLVSLNVIQVLARAGSKFAFEVIVEDGDHARFKRGVVGYLDDYFAVDARLRVEMPQKDGIDVGTLCQVDLNPLFARAEFDPRAFVAGLVAIGYEVQRSDHRVVVARRNFLPLSEIERARGNHEVRALALHRRLKVGHIERNGRADEQRTRQLGLKRDFVLRQSRNGS